jgi:glycosyltransferase involved in cell wall biosynthesis
LKILHYVDENYLTWGRPWLQLLKYLEKCGVNNHVLCRPGGTLGKQVSENNIDLYTYKPLFSWLPQACFGVRRILNKIKPDIVHSRLSSAAFIGGFWGNRMHIPVVSTIDKYPKRKYYDHSTKLIPCSNAIATHMKKQGFSDSDMQVIFNPVNVIEYRRDVLQRKQIRETNGIQETDLVFLAAGRLVDWKGFDTLLQACSRLEKKSGAVWDWKIWLAGEGPERQKLELFVESSPDLRSRVKFWGFVDDIRPLMWASDLFVLPSHNEPFGLVLLEAMACGLPIIATSSGGPLDLVSNEWGWFFQAGDVQALVKRLTFVIDADDLSNYSQLAQAAAENFSVEEIGDQTIRFYENIIRNKQNASQ